MRHVNERSSYDREHPEVIEFDTWGEFIDHVETVNPTKGADNESHNTKGAGWCSATWSEAINLARHGWTKGESYVAKRAKRLEDRIAHRIVREDWNYDVEGMAFDVARYLTNEPEHWIRPEDSVVTSDAGTRHVKIVANVSASCQVTDEAIRARGATIAALVELLEYSGQCVEVHIIMATTNQSKGAPVHAFSVRVKAFDQKLDMGRIAFALAHSATLRRFGFRMNESAHHSIVREIGSSAYSYGYPAEFDKLGETSLYLPAAKGWDNDVDWTSVESAEAWILAKLAEQGVVLRDD